MHFIVPTISRCFVMAHAHRFRPILRKWTAMKSSISGLMFIRTTILVHSKFRIFVLRFRSFCWKSWDRWMQHLTDGYCSSSKAITVYALSIVFKCSSLSGLNCISLSLASAHESRSNEVRAQIPIAWAPRRSHSSTISLNALSIVGWEWGSSRWNTWKLNWSSSIQYRNKQCNIVTEINV